MSLKSNFSRTVTRRITLKEMHGYAFSQARTAEDVVAANGVVLIPKNALLTDLAPSLEALEKSLRRWDVLSILITIENPINAEDIEDILKNARKNVLTVDPQLVNETVTQIKNVYGRIEEGNSRPEDISLLAVQGRTIAREVAQTPQLMLCLGKVRDWDEYTYIHSINAALLGGYLASRLFPDDTAFIESVSVGAILHDLGKARIPQKILNKPGKFTADEFAIMKNHPIYGEEIARASGVNNAIALSVIRGHHERCCGSGYPLGLKKEYISMASRIAAVADVFDALTTARVYRKRMESRAAVSLMVKTMGGYFDHRVVHALLVSIGLFPPGTGVELSDGSFGVVVGSSGKDLMRPKVRLHVDSLGRKVESFQIIDLNQSEKLYVKRPVWGMGKDAF